jgi:hypothetical protein
MGSNGSAIAGADASVLVLIDTCQNDLLMLLQQLRFHAPKGVAAVGARAMALACSNTMAQA